MFAVYSLQFLIFGIVLGANYEEFFKFKDVHFSAFAVIVIGMTLIAIEVFFHGIFFFLKRDSSIISASLSIFELLTLVYTIWGVTILLSNEMSQFSSTSSHFVSEFQGVYFVFSYTVIIRSVLTILYCFKLSFRLCYIREVQSVLKNNRNQTKLQKLKAIEDHLKSIA